MIDFGGRHYRISDDAKWTWKCILSVLYVMLRHPVTAWKALKGDEVAEKRLTAYEVPFLYRVGWLQLHEYQPLPTLDVSPSGDPRAYMAEVTVNDLAEVLARKRGVMAKLIPCYCPVCHEQMKPVTHEGHDQFWCAFHGYFLTGLDDDGAMHAVD